ncbi:unnamed protein product [Durusdinium trenchii]
MVDCEAEEDGGGLFLHKSYVTKHAGLLLSKRCIAKFGGGVASLDGQVRQHGGQISFDQCEAVEGGGLASWNGDVVLKGRVIAEHCAASNQGGGFYVQGHIAQEGGYVAFHQCSAEKAGGGIFLHGTLSQMDGELRLNECKSSHRSKSSRLSDQSPTYGGGVWVQDGDIKQHGGTMSFLGCSASGYGGGLGVTAGSIKQMGGQIRLDACEAKWSGGGIYLQGNLSQLDGTMNLKGCHSRQEEKNTERGGGGVWVESGEVHQQGGAMSFSNCTAAGFGGGLGVAAGNIRQGGGHLDLEDCGAGRSGGGVYVKGSVFQTTGLLHVSRCVCENGGGGMLVREGDVNQDGGSMSFASCMSENYGGGLAVAGGSIKQQGGRQEFNRCAAGEAGGGMFVNLGNVSQTDGTVTFNGCKGDFGGGGAWVQSGEVHQQGGGMSFTNCTAPFGYGGGLRVFEGHIRQEGGRLDLHRCVAKEYGGGIHVNGSVSQTNGLLQFSRCSASSGGGMAVYPGDVNQQNGSMSFTDCQGTELGGGLLVADGSVTQRGGRLEFEGCRAPAIAGGGILVLKGDVSQFDGTMTFTDCSSGPEGGGGLSVHMGDVNQQGGSMTFSKCHASGYGGCLALLVGSIKQLAGHMHFEDCDAKRSGGGIYVKGKGFQTNGTMSLTRCRSLQKQKVASNEAIWGGGGVWLESGDMHQQGGAISMTTCSAASGWGGGLGVALGNIKQSSGLLELDGCVARQSGGGIYVKGNLSQVDGTMNLKGCLSNRVAGVGNGVARGGGGGVWVDLGEVHQDGGAIWITKCSAAGAYGGGLGVGAGSFQQKSGRLELHGCEAGQSGGGMYVKSYLSQVGGTMNIRNCKSMQGWGADKNSVWGGGGVWVELGEVHQYGGAISFTKCRAILGYGGGLGVAAGTIKQLAGHLQFKECEAKRSGGGIYLKGSLFQVEGTMGLHACKSLTKQKGAGDESAWGGGGVWVESGEVQQDGGAISFTKCSAAGPGGGLAIAGNIKQRDGLLQFNGCNSTDSGGGIYVWGSLSQTNGTLELKTCSSQQDGGGVSVHNGDVNQDAGHISFTKCSSASGGGLAVTHGQVERKGGLLDFNDCQADESGGCLNIQGGLFQRDGSMRFENCTSTSPYGYGGAINIEGGGFFQMNGSSEFYKCFAHSGGGGISIGRGKGLQLHDGLMFFKQCQTRSLGGGLYMQGVGARVHGKLRFVECESYKAGGGMYVDLAKESFTLTGTMQFEQCKTLGWKLELGMGGGGGLFLGNGKFIQASGKMKFNDCTAWPSGGGMFLTRVDLTANGETHFNRCMAKSDVGATTSGGGLFFRKGRIVQAGGTMSFDRCEASQGGGAALSHANWAHQAGNLHALDCQAREGGGFHVAQSTMEQLGGTMFFKRCNATKDGGCIETVRSSFNQLEEGTLRFEECNATRIGGAFASFDHKQLVSNGTMFFDSCMAREKSAMYVEGDAALGHVICQDFNPRASSVIYVVGSLQVHSMQLQNRHTDVSFRVHATKSLRVKEAVDCSDTRKRCLFESFASSSAHLLCPPGTGLVRDDIGNKQFVGCLPCPPGSTQLVQRATRECAPCRSEFESCNRDRVKMKQGLMSEEVENVTASNLHVHHCPNPHACPGGQVPQNRFGKQMCKVGHVGNGCLMCNASTHAAFDSDALSCTRCATSQLRQFTQFGYMIFRDLGIFLIAYRGGLKAAEQKDAKTSSILLNQLLAFGAVANIGVVAALNTGVAQAVRDRVGMSISDLMHALVLESQWNPGESSGSMSAQCLLTYIGLPPEMWIAHVFASIVPFTLILVFGLAHDPALALIAGSNCFLPAFCANFAKYVVYFRTEIIQPLGEDGKEVLGDPRYEFLPKFLQPLPIFSLTLFCILVLLCFIIAATTWTRAARSTTTPVPPHVALLTRPYEDHCKCMEVERLLRKMILKTLAAALPITAYPVLQLTFVGIIMLFPLCLYSHLLPYKTMEKGTLNWLNLTEIFLISAGIIIINLANLIIASNSHWATTTESQLLFFMLILSSAVLIGLALGLLIAGFLFVEMFLGNG